MIQRIHGNTIHEWNARFYDLSGLVRCWEYGPMRRYSAFGETRDPKSQDTRFNSCPKIGRLTSLPSTIPRILASSYLRWWLWRYQEANWQCCPCGFRQVTLRTTRQQFARERSEDQKVGPAAEAECNWTWGRLSVLRRWWTVSPQILFSFSSSSWLFSSLKFVQPPLTLVFLCF